MDLLAPALAGLAAYAAVFVTVTARRLARRRAAPAALLRAELGPMPPPPAPRPEPAGLGAVGPVWPAGRTDATP